MPSEPSLRRFIAARADFPVIERGGYASAYRFDLDKAAAFVRLNWRDGRHERVRRVERQQLILDLGDET